MITHPHKSWYGDLFVQVGLHDALLLPIFPPIPVPVKYLPHLSAGTLSQASWRGGNKDNERKVLADGQPVASRGHDVKGCVLPHLNLGAPVAFNVFIPLLINGSSSKCQLATGGVQGKDGPIAVSIAPGLGLWVNEAWGWDALWIGCALAGVIIAGFMLALASIASKRPSPEPDDAGASGRLAR